MNKAYCPNYDNCTLVNESVLTPRELIKKNYIKDYCQGEKKEWEGCKRFIVKNAIKFCPPFVLPDTDLTLDEILDKFTEGIISSIL